MRTVVFECKGAGNNGWLSVHAGCYSTGSSKAYHCDLIDLPTHVLTITYICLMRGPPTPATLVH